MTTITAELRTKIERRSKRAWKRRREGSNEAVTRISDVTETSLNYRLPYTPDYYGQERIPVILKPDGTLEIDPKTTGMIDFLTDAVVAKLKKHGGEVRAYALTKADAKAGKTGIFSKGELKVGDGLDLKTGIDLISREAAVARVTGEDRVFVIEMKADDIENYGYGSDFRASKFTVVAELDHQTDLGFTTGLFDCITKADVEKLRKKKHIGKVRAYKYTTKDAESPVRTGVSEKIKYEAGKHYEVKDADTGVSSSCHRGINVADIDWCKANGQSGSRMFAFEFDMKDIAAIPTSTDGKFRLHRCLCVEEVDPTTFAPLAPPAPVAPTPAPIEPMLPAVVAPVDVQAPAAPAEPTVVTPAVVDQPKPKKGFFDRLFGSSDKA